MKDIERTPAPGSREPGSAPGSARTAEFGIEEVVR
jgi:hypothetical protein